MASVTVYTKERMKAIEDGTIVSGTVVGNNLILARHDGVSYNAGNVRGPAGTAGATGATGPPGFSGIEIVTSSTRPASPVEGLVIYETDTDRRYVYNGTIWIYMGGGTDPTAFRAWRNAAKVLAVSAETPNTIIFDQENYDAGNAYSTTTGRYTAPYTGHYTFHSRISVVSPADNERFICGVYVNAAERDRGTDIEAVDDFRISLEVTSNPYLTAGDLVTFGVRQTNGVGKSLEVDEVLTYAHGRRVSA